MSYHGQTSKAESRPRLAQCKQCCTHQKTHHHLGAEDEFVTFDKEKHWQVAVTNRVFCYTCQNNHSEFCHPMPARARILAHTYIQTGGQTYAMKFSEVKNTFEMINFSFRPPDPSLCSMRLIETEEKNTKHMTGQAETFAF